MTSIKLKKSSVAGKVPVDSDLAHGELAINFQDGKLFYKDASNNIKAFIDSAAVDSLITAGQGLDSAGVKSVHFGDNEKLTFGNDSDLKIYHTGSNSVIQEAGTGALTFRSNIYNFRNAANDEQVAKFTENQGAQFYYNNLKRLETGIDNVQVLNEDGGASKLKVSSNNNTIGTNAAAVELYANFFRKAGLSIFGDSIGASSPTEEWFIGRPYGQSAQPLHITSNTSGQKAAVFNQLGSVELYYNNAKKLETTADGVIVTGTINADSATISQISIPDGGVSGNRLNIGSNDDFKIYHDGSQTVISNVNGAGPIKIQGKFGEQSIIANQDGAVELYYNNSKKIETTDSGVTVTGSLIADSASLSKATITSSGTMGTISASVAANAYLKITDGTNTLGFDGNEITQATSGAPGPLGIGTSQLVIRPGNNSSAFVANFNANAQTDLYYNQVKKFETTDSGVNITGNLRVNNAPFSSGIDSNAVTTLIDSAYVLSRGGASIEVLQDDSSLSHLQRLSFAPVITDGEVLLQPKISVLDSAGTESLLNINFAGGGGVDSAATIAIVNNALLSADSATFNQISIPDGAALGATNRINVGSSDDLKIYHDGFNSHIAEGGTGDLNISGTNNIILKSSPTGEFYAIFRNNGAAELYHNNNKKIETTDSGATITGSITADSAVLPTIFLDSDGYADRPRISRTGGSSFSRNTVQINTATGYLQLGPANGLFSHFLTDLPRFYFNKRINVDEGIITSYDEDLQLQRVNVTRVTLTDSGATVDGRLRADSATISGLKLPTADGTVNQAILTDGNGNLTFGTVALSSAGGVAGVFNQVAVNSFTGDSSTTAFTLAAAPVGGKNSVVITINGIVQHVNSYSLAGSTITLDSAPQSGDAIEMRTHDDYVANVQLRDYTSYVYTPSTNTTAFSGADANGNTLAYDQGKVQVYLNGAKLVTGSDYTETSGTTLTLDSAIGSGDTLEIVSLSKAAIADFGVLPVDSDLTTTTANQIIHEFNRSDFRTVKYLVQLEHDSDNKYHSEEILLTHNNTTVAMTTYAQILLDSNLGSFDADISGANVRLKLTPTKTNTSVKLRAIRVGA